MSIEKPQTYLEKNSDKIKAIISMSGERASEMPVEDMRMLFPDASDSDINDIIETLRQESDKIKKTKPYLEPRLPWMDNTQKYTEDLPPDLQD